MFNVGIIAAGRAGPRVKITDRELVEFYAGFPSTYYLAVTARNNGELQYGSYGHLAPGEWLVTGAAADYQARFTYQAGTYPNYVLGTSMSAWTPLSTLQSVGWAQEGGTPAAGRLLLEIRDASTLQVLASARYWAPGFAP